jgi:hypothetical protein
MVQSFAAEDRQECDFTQGRCNQHLTEP